MVGASVAIQCLVGWTRFQTNAEALPEMGVLADEGLPSHQSTLRTRVPSGLGMVANRLGQGDLHPQWAATGLA